MSEVTNIAPATGREAVMAASLERLKAEYAVPIEEPDTEDGTPDNTMESEPDDASGSVKQEEDESDTEDGTPEDDEPEQDGWEQRFKDTQAKLTETAQELSRLRSEQAESMAEITRTSYELQDKFAEQEQAATFWANIAQADFQRLQQVDVRTLTQDQYAQWSQQTSQAAQKAQQLTQALQYTTGKAKEVRDSARQREAAIARATLTRTIDNFDEAYGKIGQFAVEKGVNPQVFREITDPGLIKLIHEVMTLSNQPDAIETVVTKTKAKAQKARNIAVRDEAGKFKKAEQDFRNAKTPQQRKAAYLAKEQMRLIKEYGN